MMETWCAGGRGVLSRAIVAAFWMVSHVCVCGENWPQWRGPRGDGVSVETRLPVQWSATQNVAWKRALPGEGHSSPIVWEGQAFATAVDGRRRLLLKFDREGKLAWEKVAFSAAIESMHNENSAASSTPLTDGGKVFTSFQNGRRVDVRAFDFSGKELWAVQPLQFAGMHGYSYSPVLHNDLLIFDFCQDDESAVIALDKNNGELRWRFDRPNKEISHVAPLIVPALGGVQVVVCGANEIRSFDPVSGQSLWWCDGPTDVCVAGLVYGGGLVFANGGYPRRSRMAVDVDGRGDVTGTHVAWNTIRQVSYVPSPVYHDGHFYMVVDEGMLFCFDAKSGNAVWDHRLGGRFRSSLVMASGNIYATDTKGLTTVFRANPARFELVASNNVNEFCYATPAISEGRLYVRTGKHLFCISAAEAETPGRGR